MKSENVNSDFALQLEMAERDAWFDMWDAQTYNVIQNFKLKKKSLGSASMLFSPINQFSHFNQIMGFGLANLATETELDTILSLYRNEGIKNIEIHILPHTQPAQLKEWLLNRGLRRISSWDRIYRNSEPLLYDQYKLPEMTVEKVNEKNKEEWCNFLVNSYNLQATKPIAENFAIRNGWHHYILRQYRKIMAIRSQYISPEGIAWWGVEAPVPGFMTSRFDLDHHLCGEMIHDGLQLGVKLFVGEVEAAHPNFDNDAYRFYNKLGFKHVYLRTNYSF